ncbi:MAG: ATP-binding protein [Pseudomonadota bacterium]
MNLFFLSDEILAFEAELASLRGEARLPLLIPLAWALRQLDCQRALLLADEAKDLLDLNLDVSELPQRQTRYARLLLIRGECASLFAELDDAEQDAKAALALFETSFDPIGVGDAKCLLASIWHERGDARLRDEFLEAAIVDYVLAGDTVRIDASRARLLERAAFRDPAATALRLAQLFDTGKSYSPIVRVWIASALAIVARLTGDSASAIRYFLQAQLAGQESGQIRQAILSASNGADAFASLGDLDAALEWNERALVLARRAAWPAMVGACLLQTGNVLRLLERHADAQKTLNEALAAMSMLTGAYAYAIAVQYLGDLALDVGEPLAALDYFTQAERRASALGEPIFVLRCWRGEANALCRLAQPAQAKEKLAAALALAKQEGSADEQIMVLRVYAELYRQYDLADVDELHESATCLNYLNQALEVAAGINGYIVPAELLDEVANAYAASGEYRLAFINGQAAARARDNQRLVDARNRAIAMQVRQETAQAHAETEHHRQLAQTETRRALALQEASATLETLGQIGREITASLNSNAVFSALHSHLNQLLDATAFFVYLLEPDGQTLKGVFSIEADQVFESKIFPLDHPTSFTARCARERREIVINIAPEELRPNLTVGTLDTVSLLFAPLLIGDRLLGVMSIQSLQAHAYAERERSIFRTLCAYAAIALDNAGAYAMAESAQQQAHDALLELRQAQVQLVQSEKLASLGRLVIGVSHELNTPLGNGLMALTTLQDQIESLEQSMLESGLRRQTFENFLDNVKEASNIAVRNLDRSANLVNSFKKISADRTGLKRKLFTLNELIDSVLAELAPRLKILPCKIQLNAVPDVRLSSFPEVLSDVLQRLIDNAIVHGFEQRDHGLITLLFEVEGETNLRITVKDDGEGVAEEIRKKIFDPFFTTRLGQGTSGLGLHIAHNAVTQILGGSLTILSQSEVDYRGCAFAIDLPLVAPD